MQEASLSFHYLPSKKQFFAVGSDTVAIFDPAKEPVDRCEAERPGPKGYDAAAASIPKRNRIYRNDGDGLKG